MNERPVPRDRLGPDGALPDAVIERARSLPLSPAPTTLVGERAVLRPFDAERDGEELHRISDGRPIQRLGSAASAYDADLAIWHYLPVGPFETTLALVQFHEFIEACPDSTVFTVEDRATGDLLGSMAFLENEPHHLKIEIGCVWLTPAVQGTGLNIECTRLLLAHAFSLGYLRVEWRCDSENTRSRRAAERAGFTLEAVRECFVISKGRSRSTAWYRYLASEWGAPVGSGSSGADGA